MENKQKTTNQQIVELLREIADDKREMAEFIRAYCNENDMELDSQFESEFALRGSRRTQRILAGIEAGLVNSDESYNPPIDTQISQWSDMGTETRLRLIASGGELIVDSVENESEYCTDGCNCALPKAE